MKSALRERKDDFYETPDQATLALLRVTTLPPVIWEPSAGRGAISRLLEAAGHSVIKQDLVAHSGADAGILTPIDFLMETKAPDGCSCIVMNPPYKLADQFIRHGLALGCRCYVLLRLMALEGAGRSDLIDFHLVKVFAGIERLPTMHRDGWEGPRITNSGAPFAWFVFDPIGRGKGTPIMLERMSWRHTQ